MDLIDAKNAIESVWNIHIETLLNLKWHFIEKANRSFKRQILFRIQRVKNNINDDEMTNKIIKIAFRLQLLYSIITDWMRYLIFSIKPYFQITIFLCFMLSVKILVFLCLPFCYHFFPQQLETGILLIHRKYINYRK